MLRTSRSVVPNRVLSACFAAAIVAVGCGSPAENGRAKRGPAEDGPAELGPAELGPPEPPSFVDLGDLTVIVDGVPSRLGDSTLQYHRRSVGAFDDPATPDHDGINSLARRFLACEADEWSLGNQTFTVDVIADGIDQHDPTLIQRGVIGVTWGASLPLGADGVHSLHRDCDGATNEDLGGTHHSTQWLVDMARAVYLLKSVEGGGYENDIERYIQRIEEIAARLVTDENAAAWEERWLVDRDGNTFTHKAYMRAAGLQLAASLTSDADQAELWSEHAEAIARRGIEAQRDDGVNPERGGYDVMYQMYGTWLAQLYLSVLPDSSPVRPQIETTIDRAIAWMVGRTDPETGQVDIGESTRTCISIDGDQPFESAVQVRVFLYQAWTHAEQNQLTDLAVLVDHFAKTAGNPCPER